MGGGSNKKKSSALFRLNKDLQKSGSKVQKLWTHKKDN